MTNLETYYANNWKQIVTKIYDTKYYDESVFKLIFDDTKLVSMSDNKLIITAPTNLVVIMLNQEKTYINTQVNDYFKPDTSYDCQFVLDKDYIAVKEAPEKNKALEFVDGIREDFTFDNFVVGNSNKQAQAAAVACAYNPGNFYNPLFIYGDSGLGKTHLLHAIGNYLKKNHPEMKVLYLPTYDLISRFINSTGHNAPISASALAESISSVDVLLVDDVQFLSGKSKTNDFFFQIYNNLVNNRKQIVITSDKSPYELNSVNIEDRLVSRFSSGLTVTITSPEFNTRLEILRQKVKEQKIGDAGSIDDASLAYIATNCTGDVRKLEGILNQLLFHQIQFPEMNLKSSLKEIFKTNVDDDKQDPTKIIRCVGDYYHLTKQQLLSKSRSANIVTARHIAMYLCRNKLDLPFSKIGQYFNNCDHTTVISACNKIAKLEKEDAQYAAAIKEIDSRLN